ncbi:hypothetical protein BDV33DRAFT_227577 [Aspergillus novoparasiticus]|uniref:Rhodopsin domain-containing protein n=1 Tax=Aspergillus novoparasiticus TaxID=986946 RepID=A0A5N6EDR7_9EURO|nr:hypothetical protein BDV33DRAFT_227577 [Aspergillus novoparasiticus]
MYTTASSSNQDTPILPDHHTTAGLLAEYYTLTVIALALVLLRAWVFLRLTRTGAGTTHVSPPILKVNVIYQMINVICALVTKYSISLYILRIRNSRAVRWILAWLMLFMTLATIEIADKDVPGTCLPPKSVYSVAYVQSGFTIVIDRCLTSAPVITLWDVKIKRGRKTLICGLMSLGLVATVSNALRNAYQGGLTAPDMSYAITNVAIVSILEGGTGVIAASEPVTNSHRHKEISVIMGGQWDEGSGNWSLGNTTSDSIALCGVKSPGRVFTKVAAC